MNVPVHNFPFLANRSFCSWTRNTCFSDRPTRLARSVRSCSNRHPNGMVSISSLAPAAAIALRVGTESALGGPKSYSATTNSCKDSLSSRLPGTVGRSCSQGKRALPSLSWTDFLPAPHESSERSGPAVVVTLRSKILRSSFRSTNRLHEERIKRSTRKCQRKHTVYRLNHQSA